MKYDDSQWKYLIELDGENELEALHNLAIHCRLYDLAKNLRLKLIANRNRGVDMGSAITRRKWREYFEQEIWRQYASEAKDMVKTGLYTQCFVCGQKLPVEEE